MLSFIISGKSCLNYYGFPISNIFKIKAIYKTEKTQLGTFLEITRSILETMARYAEEIEKMIHVNFHGSMDNVPEETRHTILLYHQVQYRIALFTYHHSANFTSV